VQGTTPQLTASDFARKPGGRAARNLRKKRAAHPVGGVNVEKILTPEERADKDKLVASLQHRLLQSTLETDQQEALREFLDSKTKMNDADIRRHPAGDVHAGISSNMRRL
jgi:hypothetical protein